MKGIEERFKKPGFLFLFSIGPVQDFIRQARKTQDFYAGSFLLSYLTWIALKEISSNLKDKVAVIYPDISEHPWLEGSYTLYPTIPNRFVALISEERKEEISALAERLKKAIKEEICKIKESLKNKLIKQELEGELKESFEAQLSEFPQIFWVAVKWEPSEVNYQDAYSSLERAMGARKNLRAFSQYCEAGRKCSVCGEKNVLFFREEENPKKFTQFNPCALNVSKRVSLKYIAQGEGLCGVCLLKRGLGEYLADISPVFKNLNFPSTAEVASADFKKEAFLKAKEELESYQKAFKEVTEKFPEAGFLPSLEVSPSLEGYWFYEENLTKDKFEKDLEVSVSEDKLERLHKALKAITKKVGSPNPYYAVIKLDGDNMGKWLAGEFFEDKKITPERHLKISQALKNYALELVPEIVEKQALGKLVYSGGDDVLAFVNLRDLLKVMYALRAAFSGHIKINDKKIEVDWENASGKAKKNGKEVLTLGSEATASMGVVIAHYKTPLQLVLKKANEALETAKSFPDKDAFCIVLMKRSGEERIAKFKWRYDEMDTLSELIEVLNGFNNAFSPRFIYKLRESFSLFAEEESFPLSNEAFKSELYRLLLRSYSVDKKGAEKEKFVKDFAEKLFNLYLNSGEDFQNFVNLLLILKEIKVTQGEESDDSKN